MIIKAMFDILKEKIINGEKTVDEIINQEYKAEIQKLIDSKELIVKTQQENITTN